MLVYASIRMKQGRSTVAGFTIVGRSNLVPNTTVNGDFRSLRKVMPECDKIAEMQENRRGSSTRGASRWHTQPPIMGGYETFLHACDEVHSNLGGASAPAAPPSFIPIGDILFITVSKRGGLERRFETGGKGAHYDFLEPPFLFLDGPVCSAEQRFCR